MTALPRTPRLRLVDGPRTAGVTDIDELNEVFTQAFTDRYRRDGMSGVRVPPLNPAIWRYAIQDAGDGALCWEDESGRIVAFNMVHLSGAEGWMGPLCVRPEMQGSGVGKSIVSAGIAHLRASGARVIGLETMPRTMDNIGFYSGLGFVPGNLTLTLTLDAAASTTPPTLLSRIPFHDRVVAIEACRLLSDRVMAGYDFTRELDLTDRLTLGDTLLLGPASAPTGFALYHTVPLVEGRPRDELRVLKMVLQNREDLALIVDQLRDQARRAGTHRIAIRLQGEYSDVYRSLMQMGGRVRWTDLRMSVYGSVERLPDQGLVLSNWEI